MITDRCRNPPRSYEYLGIHYTLSSDHALAFLSRFPLSLFPCPVSCFPSSILGLLADTTCILTLFPLFLLPPPKYFGGEAFCVSHGFRIIGSWLECPRFRCFRVVTLRILLLLLLLPPLLPLPCLHPACFCQRDRIRQPRNLYHPTVPTSPLASQEVWKFEPLNPWR